MRNPVRAVAFALAAVAITAIGWLAWRDQGRLRITTLWPLELASPGGWLIDRRLRELQGDPELCARVVIEPHATATPVADAPSKEGCGWANAMRTVALGGVRINANPLSCELTAALALWFTHVVQPSAQALLVDRVVAVEHHGGYACRNIKGSPQFGHIRSEHARANALDIKAFKLASGKQIQVARHWDSAGPEGRFLAEIHARACRFFRVAIGPAYNAAHRDHFHYDRGSFRACR